MLKGDLIHPQVLAALGRAGHGSKVLITDGNFPNQTRRGPNAELVFLNFAPGMLTVTDVLSRLLRVIPVEAAEVMVPSREGPYAMQGDPPIFGEFEALLRDAGQAETLTHLERNAFYRAASTEEVCLTLATGEERIYANLLLTIGVVR